MELYSSTLTRTSFSKILYKNQIVEQWKEIAKTKCTLRWVSGGGMENYGKSSSRNANEFKRLKPLSLKKRGAVSEMSSTQNPCTVLASLNMKGRSQK